MCHCPSPGLACSPGPGPSLVAQGRWHGFKCTFRRVLFKFKLRDRHERVPVTVNR